jgi:hypothetical protein
MLESLLAWVTLSTLNWHWFLGFSAVPFFILLALYPIIPGIIPFQLLSVHILYSFIIESVRYLLVTGRVHDANKQLEFIASLNGTTLPQGII